MPLSNLSFTSRSLVAPRFLGNLTAELMHGGDRGNDDGLNKDGTSDQSNRKSATHVRGMNLDQGITVDAPIVLNNIRHLNTEENVVLRKV